MRAQSATRGISEDGSEGRSAYLLHEHRTDAISIDDVFSQHIGEFGVGQFWLFCVVSAPWLPGALLTLNMAFMSTIPQELSLQRIF
jgi:hypothetical protein